MYAEIEYRVEEPVGWIVLNRPERLNAWTGRMGAEVKHAMAAAEADPRVVGIVLTGAGRGFCAGADLQDLRGLSKGTGTGSSTPEELEAEPGDRTMEDFRGTYTYLASLRKPVIAAINGATAGMAVPIACAADLRFASERALFTCSFSQRGLIAEWGASWILPRLIGPSRALDLLWSSRKVGAAEAFSLGLVDRVFPHEELLAECRRYVEDLAANCSPTSIATMKRQVWQQLHASLGPSEREAVKLMLETFRHPDFREGVSAFLEKRPPNFQRLGT